MVITVACLQQYNALHFLTPKISVLRFVFKSAFCRYYFSTYFMKSAENHVVVVVVLLLVVPPVFCILFVLIKTNQLVWRYYELK